MDDAFLHVAHLLVLQIPDPELPVVRGLVVAALLPLGAIVDDVVFELHGVAQLEVQLGYVRLKDHK